MPYFSFQKIVIFQTWGLFLALGFLIPFVFVLKQAKKEGMNPQVIWDIFLWIAAGSIIGMRLGYVFQFLKEYLANPWEIVKFWDGGLTFYGGLIGGIGGAILFAKHSKIDKKVLWKILDVFALYFPLGIIIARIGCFLINDHQGAVTSLPWGIMWPDGTIRHPVALYLMLNGLLIFSVLSLLRSKLEKPGNLFFFLLFFYSLTRFFLDFTRSSETVLSDPHYFNLTVSQWVSLLIIFISVLAMTIPRLKARRRR